MGSSSVKQCCPVQCKYCMASRIDARSTFWNNGYRVGVNKTCTFLNRFPGDPELKDMDLPWNDLEGDYVGFEGASDCMWSVYRKDLEWMIDHLDQFRIRKLVLTTKIPDVPLELLRKNPRVCVVFSMTGLDTLEQTKTADRLNAMIRLRDAGVETHAIIHPYIHGYSDLSFLKEFRSAGFTEIGLKGFRYNPSTMNLAEIPERILKQYRGNEDEENIGIQDAARVITEEGLRVAGLREMVHTDSTDFGISAERAKEEVSDLFRQSVISSSDKNYDSIFQAVVNRKIWGNIQGR